MLRTPGRACAMPAGFIPSFLFLIFSKVARSRVGMFFRQNVFSVSQAIYLYVSGRTSTG